MMLFHSGGFGRGNAEVIETEMAQNPSLCPACAAGDGEAPDRAALASRHGPASRLIGTFAALCQFSKEWHPKNLLLFRHDFLVSLSNLTERLDKARSPSIPRLIMVMAWRASRCWSTALV